MNLRQPGELAEHLFREQAGRLTAYLVRRFGPRHLDLAEEAVQTAMMRALQSWPQTGVPENPEAWLFRVAGNAGLDALRRLRFQAPEVALERLTADEVPGEGLGALGDDELRLIFLTCHPDIPREARVALSLKVACGFSVSEIARAFLSDEAAIAQRIVRAKRRIRDGSLTLDLPGAAELGARLDSVLEVIYLVFNEGYAAHAGEDLIRLDLCGEALRLARLLAGSGFTRPDVHALAALVAFQTARLPARVDASGDLILLENQDRALWDQRLIALGYWHFERCMDGERVTAYHAQAAIAATYARSRSLEDIEWRVILELFDQLVELAPGPVVALNRAVALAKVEGAGAALEVTAGLRRELEGYYLLEAVEGHLFLELGQREEAAERFRIALRAEVASPVRRHLERKLEAASG